MFSSDSLRLGCACFDFALTETGIHCIQLQRKLEQLAKFDFIFRKLKRTRLKISSALCVCFKSTLCCTSVTVTSWGQGTRTTLPSQIQVIMKSHYSL